MQPILNLRAGLAVAAFAALTFSAQEASAQGCVAGRCPVGQIPITPGLELNTLPFSGWQLTLGYRNLHSDRHFVGTEEQKERQREGSQVINDLNTFDLGLTYSFNPRLSLTFSLPYVDNKRSSVVRNSQQVIMGRSHVQASGIGDARLSANYWLFDPSSHAAPAEPTGKGGKGTAPAAPGHTERRGNIRLSVGIDAPTGKKDVKDHRQVYSNTTGQIEVDPVKVIVDQSIQPGDGGWGIPIDLYAYYRFTDRLTGYLQGSYLITPEEKNGVRTGRGSFTDPNNFEKIMSIGDTFMVRGGAEYLLFPAQGLSVGLGLRSEGQPVYDLVGGSDGFRRPGMNIAVEPSLTWAKNGWSASLSVPITFYNERFQSVPDKQRQAATGVPRHGDAAFADYYVMFTVGKQF
jgi:hypothetical protein